MAPQPILDKRLLPFVPLQHMPDRQHYHLDHSCCSLGRWARHRELGEFALQEHLVAEERVSI